MKPIHYAPPLIALMIGAAWLASLRNSNRELEQSNLSLQRKIVEASNSSGVKSDRERTGTKGAKAKREKKPSNEEIKPSDEWVNTSRDWSELVMFNNNEGARFNLTAACRRLEKLASEMSGDELVRAYTEMAALPVEAEFRNPEFAFSQYLAKCQNESIDPVRMGDFRKWLARDPAAATAWYESQVAGEVFDKTLDGKSPTMIPFESAFIMSLLASDPAAAEQRLNNLPPDLRASVGTYVWDVPKENSKDFVDMLRRSMPMEQYMAILKDNSLTDNFRFDSKSDPKDIQENMERLGFSPEERSTLMAQQFAEAAKYRAMRDTGNDPSREKFDDLRARIQAIDPSSADQATGVALQSYLESSKTTGAQDFVEKIATDYHDSGAGDELLIPLIEGSANGSISYPKDRARVLATKISDDTLREEMLRKLN
jgi:hypothetical protein